MAKHRDANADTEPEGRSEFIRDNADVIIRRLEATAARYVEIINKQDKVIALLKKQRGKKKKMLTMRDDRDARFLRFHRYENSDGEEFINVRNIQGAELRNGVLYIKIIEDDPAFPEFEPISIGGKDVEVAAEVLRELSVPIQEKVGRII